jgi:glyoxylase-like metal-dependent hydrolase (beta-lactamase superfamily II)
MHIHHINCATMCPFSARLINGTDGILGLLKPGRMVCHCLVVETNDGLVLVDTGLGKGDIFDPRGRLGSFFVAVTRPRLDPQETALEQIIKLGFKANDVRHIVPTHLDLDHIGGLSDFPKAKVHVFEPEYEAAMKPKTVSEKNRYRAAQWAHKPSWVIHKPQGERWKGFDSVRPIDAVSPDLLIIPVIGHTRGHSAIAVKSGKGWIVHCGDAYFFHKEMDPQNPDCTFGLSLFQNIVQMDGDARVKNQERLRTLARDNKDVELFCAHDIVEFSKYETASNFEVQAQRS